MRNVPWPRGVDHLARLGGVHGERLLGEHGLTRVDREQRGVGG